MIQARLPKAIYLWVAVISLSFLSACSEEPTTGAADIRWDREICERCLMAVGDRRFAAQIRGGESEEVKKLYKFDDLGCAVLWLDQQAWKDNQLTEIWVTDFKTEQWIDAKTAHYVKDQLSPMNYGLGAQTESAPDSLNFVEASAHIYKIEEKYNLHNGTLHTTPFDNSQPQPSNQAPVE